MHNARLPAENLKQWIVFRLEPGVIDRKLAVVDIDLVKYYGITWITLIDILKLLGFYFT